MTIHPLLFSANSTLYLNQTIWMDIIETPYEEQYHPFTFDDLLPNTKYDVFAVISNECGWSRKAEFINHSIASFVVY